MSDSRTWARILLPFRHVRSGRLIERGDRSDGAMQTAACLQERRAEVAKRPAKLNMDPSNSTTEYGGRWSFAGVFTHDRASGTRQVSWRG